MTEYFVILHNEKRKTYQRMAAFLLATTILLHIYVWLQTPFALSITIGLCTCILLAFAAIIISLYLPTTQYASPLFLLSFFTASAVWLLYGYYWIVALFIVLIILYPLATKPIKITITENAISYPRWPYQKLAWTNVTNVVLKDGLFTIDFSSNKILQQHILETNVKNETEFNDFCRQQLNQ
jgi:hypothetical protein